MRRLVVLGVVLFASWSSQANVSAPSIMQTSVRIESLRTLVPLQDAIREITGAIGFKTTRNGLTPEYQKSFAEYKRFVTEYHMTKTTFLVAENIDDADCIVIKLYSDAFNKEQGLAIEDQINRGIRRHFPKGVEVYPNSVCGFSGEFEG